LPGAVRVAVEDPARDVDLVPEQDEEAAVLKFSLAGVQLKLSAVRDSDRGLTIPAHGRGGDWIVKLPGLRFSHVPENEWSMMTLAREVGLDVAEVDLVPVAKIHNLPDVPMDPSALALAVRRFDRIAHGRVHIEDFAQVLDVRTPDKYKAANFETIGRGVVAIAPSSAQEFFRRVIFIVAIGNGDAHVKNWSLIYRDGVHATLSPAYDLVSTIEFLPNDDLGLNLAKSKAFADVDLASLERLARRAAIEIDVRSVVGQTVQQIRSTWAKRRNDLPMSSEAKLRIDEHWKRVPLMRL
jgi:serine/threonine-protein kinase HipA